MKALNRLTSAFLAAAARMLQVFSTDARRGHHSGISGDRRDDKLQYPYALARRYSKRYGGNQH